MPTAATFCKDAFFAFSGLLVGTSLKFWVLYICLNGEKQIEDFSLR